MVRHKGGPPTSPYHLYSCVSFAMKIVAKATAFCTGVLFFGPPFLKKGPLKLQKGAHWALIGQFLE